MDEEYASPDSDGHASLPSPTDTTFDLSQIPLRHRGRAPDPITVSSSFVRTPGGDDSDDDSEGDMTIDPDRLPHQSYHMLETSPLLPSASKSHSGILTPVNSKNDGNTRRTSSRRMTQTPRKTQPRSPGQGENIDPKQRQGSGKPSPPRLVVHKPDYGTDDEGEEAVVDKTVLVAKAGATQPMGPELSTPFGDAYERSLDVFPAAPSTPDKPGSSKQATLRSRRNSLPKTASLVVAPPSPPPSASPQQESPQLPGPSDNIHRLTPKTPRLRYYNWLSSDDADDESREIPAGHSSRLKKAQAQRIVDETAFLGGDEASLLVADTSVNNEMLDVFHMKDPVNEGHKAPDGNSGLEEARLTTLSEEPTPPPPLRPILNRSAHVASNSEAGAVEESIDGPQNQQPTYDGVQYAEDDNTQHSISFTESVRREVQQLDPESHQSDDQSKPRSPNPALQETTTDSATAHVVDSRSITPTTSDIVALMEAASSTGSLPRETAPPDPEFTLGNSSTMPQGSVNVPDSTGGAIASKFLSCGSPTPQQSFASDITTRPTTSPGQLQENSTAAAFARSPPREYPEGDIDTFPETNYPNSLHSDGFVAHSTPQDYYAGYDIWAIKKSGRGRRVSMNTPPSTLGRSVSGTEFLNNPPEFSSLGSGFSFPSQPLRYEKWDPESVRREFTPPFPVEGVDGLKRQGLRLHGADAPHNTPTPATGKGSGAPASWRKGRNMKEGKGRARSKSDPVGKKIGGKGLKKLFTQGRVEKEKTEPEYSSDEEERHDDLNDVTTGVGEKPIFPDDNEFPAIAQSDELDNDEDLINDDGLDLSDTDDDNDDGIDGRHWSGFTQDFQSSFARGNKDIPTAIGQSEPSRDPSGLSLGNVEFRVHTPASVGESKDVSHNDDVGDGSNKTLWLRMAQAEAENDRFRKLLESNNIKIEDQDLGLSGNLTIAHDSRDLSSSRNSEYNTSDDLSSLRRRVMELEGLLESLGRKDAELRSESDRKDVLVTHWRTRHDDVQKLAEQNRQRALGLESRVKGLEQQAAVDNINHDREISEVVSKLHGEKQHRRKSLGLEDRVKFFEQRVHEVQEAHRRDAEEKDRTISQLRQALDSRKGSIGPVQIGLGLDDDQRLVAELQEKLFKQQQTHEAEAQITEDKYTNLLSEQEGLVRHLQAELDEMVNLMPVDHGSSRMIDEEEAEDWLDEKSREISQYYDDGLGEIITELHGIGETEDFEEAVEEAEMSLRRVADEAGLCEPLDRVRLAAFGIRQLRSEYDVLKRLLIESETRVKSLLQANDELESGSREAQEKLKFAVAERDAFRTAAKEAEAAGNILANQVEALRAKLQEAEKHIHQLVAEHDALNRRCSDAEERVGSLEADKMSLQRLVNDTKRLNDMLKSQAAEAEQRNQGFEEEIQGLRRQLAEEKDHVSVVETETITFRQQLTEWEETATAIGKQRDGFQVQLKESADRIKAIEKEKEELSKKLLEAVKGRGNEKETDAFKRQVKELQNALKAFEEQQLISSATITQLEQKVTQSGQSAQRLSAEKEFLKAELEIAVGETKAARGRFAQLLHDTAEKEAKWAVLKQEMERSVTEGSGNPMGTAEAYRKSLAIIVQEIGKDFVYTPVEGDKEHLNISATEGIQDPDLVKVVIQAFRWRDRRLAESEERNKRYKGAAKKWMKENEKKRGRVEELLAEVRELGLKLKAEKKSSDEKLGQLILALRKGE